MTAMMTFSKNAITQGWIAFFRTLASNSGIKFVFGESQPACTDGKTVWLPSLPVELTEDDLILVKALGFHEVGHCQFSDVVFFQAFAAKHGDFARFLLNALDDVYMENKQSRATREAERYFRRKAGILFERKQFRDGSASVAEAVACYALCYLRADGWSEYRDPLAVIEANFNQFFGEHAENVRGNLNDILINEFPSVDSTQDAASLALRIISMLKALSDEDEKKQEGDQGQEPKDGGQSPSEKGSSNGQGQSDQDGEPQPGNSGGEPSGDEKNDGKSGAGGESKPQSGNEPGNDGGQGEAEPQGAGEPGDGKGKGKSKADGQEEPGAGEGQGGEGDTGKQGKKDGKDGSGDGNGRSLKEIVDEIMNAKGLGDKEVFDDREAVTTVAKSVQAGTNPNYKGQTAVPKFVIDGKLEQKGGKAGSSFGGGAGVAEVVDGMKVCPQDAAEASAMGQRQGQRAKVLACKLQSLLLQQEEADSFTTSRGQLGQNNLYRLGLGDMRLFIQTEEVERPTTAVSIVVDLSSSTQDVADQAFVKGEKLQFEATLAPSTLRSILDSVVLLEKVFDQIGCPREVLGFAPKGGELMSMVRSFGDDTQTALKRIGGLRKIAGGSHTPIGEAVFHAGRRLMSHAAKRKVMFVLTDGAPGDVTKATEMTRFCENGGMRVVYLVIGEAVRTDWLTKAGFPFTVAKTANEVAPALLAEAKRLLM